MPNSSNSAARLAWASVRAAAFLPVLLLGQGRLNSWTSLFRFERTPNFLVANAVDQPRLPGKGFGDYWAGRGVDPREWHMIMDSPEPVREIATEPLDRPVLYRRGKP